MVWGRFLELDRTAARTADIAAELGVSVKTIQRWRHKAGVARPKAPIHPPTDREVAAALIAEGCHLAEVARSVGATSKTIKQWFPGVKGLPRDDAIQIGLLVRKARAA